MRNLSRPGVVRRDDSRAGTHREFPRMQDDSRRQGNHGHLIGAGDAALASKAQPVIRAAIVDIATARQPWTIAS